MVTINSDNFMAELVFCIKQSDVVKTKALIQYFAHTDIKTQRRALYELSKAPDKFAYPVLAYLLETKSSYDEIDDKIYSLLFQISYNNREQLISYIKSKDNRRKKVFIKIAGELELVDAVPELIEVLRTEKDADIILVAISALNVIGVKESIAPIAEYLYSNHHDLRQASISALSNIGGDLAVKYLSDAIKGDDEKDALLIYAIAGINTDSAIKILSHLVGHTSVSVRNLAIDNLIKIGAKSIPIIIENLKSKNVDLIISSLNILGRIGDKAAITPIQMLIHEQPENANIRFTAYEALGFLPSTPKTAISLSTGLEDSEEFVRLAAAKAIDKNLSKILISGLKNLIEPRDEQAKNIVATIIDAQADKIFSSLAGWEVFVAVALNYLITNAHPSISERYMKILEDKGIFGKKIKYVKEEKPVQPEKKLTIYAVDDSKLMLNLYMKKLHKLGHNPFTFLHAEQAIEAIYESKPDILITDLNMPDINGVQLVQEIRTAFNPSDLPIIMITTQSDFGTNPLEGKPYFSLEEIQKAGINLLLHKPFKDSELAEAIDKCLKK
ncbi:MAG: response regulator [Desulfobacterales bacterium]|nr:response regulator [Desulfobacterales bacterium]